MATIWDIYDSFCEEVDSPENEGADFPENGVNITNGQEKKDVKSSSCSTVTTGNNMLENADSVKVLTLVSVSAQIQHTA